VVHAALALVLMTLFLVSVTTPARSSSTALTPRRPTQTFPTTVPTVPATPGRYKSLGGPPTTLPNAPNKPPEPQAPGAPVTEFPTSPALVAEGKTLYDNGCSACHGTLLKGVHGIGPSLVGVGAGPVDFYLTSGRMPLDNPRHQPDRETPAYNRHRVDALIAYITKVGGGPPAPAVDPGQGDLSVGMHQFTLNCAGCHQMVARGGLIAGAFTPNLQDASALQIAEAIRMGPYLMPHFDAKLINQHQLDSIVRYVLWTQHPSNAGGWGIYNLGPIPEGMVTWFVGLLGVVLVIRLIGERMESE
jgi:ubiquinol-cytochrome c reductase cytochrome c subunit